MKGTKAALGSADSQYSQKGCWSSPQISGPSQGLGSPCTVLPLWARSETLFYKDDNALQRKSTPFRHLSVCGEMTDVCPVISQVSLIIDKLHSHTLVSQSAFCCLVLKKKKKDDSRRNRNNTGNRKEFFKKLSLVSLECLAKKFRPLKRRKKKKKRE